MSRKRDIPFGYKMEMSRIVPDEAEANIVKKIFSLYLAGDSLKRISEQMEASGTQYHAGTCEWNKNMVKRILENNRYIGTESYPRLVDPKDFAEARRRCAEKQQKTVSCPEPIQALSKKTVCATCGERMYRLPKKGWSTRWVCQNRECGQAVTLADDRYRAEIDCALARLDQSPTLLDPPVPDEHPMTPDILRLQNELTAAFNRGTETPEYMRSLIFALAAEQYNNLPDLTLMQTLKELQDRIAVEGITKENRREIEQKAIRRILLGKESGVSIELINGKTISSKEETEQ